MRKEINVTTNQEQWNVKRELIEQGYKLVGDCYWTMVFEKGEDEVIVNRD